MPFLSPGRAKKRHSFHDWRIGRREALSTPEARKGRGSEHGGFYAARSCTSGVDRRSRTEPRVRREMNVEPEDQPKAAPHCFSGSALRAGNRPAWKRSEAWGNNWRRGTDDDLRKTFDPALHVSILPVQSRAGRSVKSVAIHRVTGRCEANRSSRLFYSEKTRQYRLKRTRKLPFRH